MLIFAVVCLGVAIVAPVLAFALLRSSQQRESAEEQILRFRQQCDNIRASWRYNPPYKAPDKPPTASELIDRIDAELLAEADGIPVVRLSMFGDDAMKSLDPLDRPFFAIPYAEDGIASFRN